MSLERYEEQLYSDVGTGHEGHRIVFSKVPTVFSSGQAVTSTTLLKICRYYSTTMCYYWDMSVKYSVYCSVN